MKNLLLASHLVGAVMLFGASSSLVLAAAPDVPSMDQIQKDYEAKKYQDVIKETSLALPLTADPSKGYDKSALLALKGESQLQLKQMAPASESYAAAAKEAKDPGLADLYRATSVLIKRSPGGNYLPKQPSTKPAGAASAAPAGKAEPINIIEMKTRKEALVALFNDESKVVGAKIDSLKNQNSLSPTLMDGIKQVGDLRGIEMVATGADTTSSQMLATVGGHVSDLINNAMKQMTQDVDKLSAKANETTPSNMVMADGNVYTVNAKKGLNSSEKNKLNTIATTAKSISATCDDLGKAIGSQQASTFTGIKQQADALAKKADDLAKTNFEPDQNQVPKAIAPQHGVGTMTGTGTGTGTHTGGAGTPQPKQPAK